ncbi:MAG: hypothetical protein OXD36_12395 [Rhodobacter sp.]|nr:hypothetical protein [Rhodobacter sp.]
MMDVEGLTAFLAWCTVINAIILALTASVLWCFRGFVERLHGRMFGLPEDRIREQYFRFLATYKAMIIVFNLVPYLALRVI